MQVFSRVRTVLAVALLCLSASSTLAEDTVVVIGKARMEYAKIDQGAYREVFYLAKVNALSQVAASFPQAKLQLFEMYRDELTGFDAIDGYIVEAAEVGKTIDTGKTKDKSLRLAVSAKVNLTALDLFFQQKTAAGLDPSGAGADFGVFFIARQMSSNKQFDQKVTSVNESKTASSADETAQVDNASSSLSSASEDLSTQSSGGSVEQKADQNLYEVRNDVTEALAAAIKEKLVDAGYEPLSSDDLVDAGYEGLVYLDEMISQGLIDDTGMMPRRLLASFKKAAIEEGWAYFGVGRVDIGMSQKDERTGALRVPATVSFEVFMEVKGKSRSIAVVAPEVVWGDSESGDAAVAAQVAQNGAVDKAMQTIIGQLQIKQLN
jgi:hypothetical protein